MKIVCDACSAKYSIADEKVRGKVFKIRCKKCSNIIVVRGSTGEEPQSFDQKETRVFDYSGYDDPNEAAAAAAAAATSDAVWHLVIDQEQVGPMTADQVRVHFAQGDIDADSYIWREGFTDWEPLSSVELFADIESSAAPPAAAAPAEAPAEDPMASMFGGPQIEDNATARSDPADLFSAAGGEQDDVGAELFGSPAAEAGGESMADSLFGSASEPDDEEAEDAAERQLRGQRNENSVLFSLNNLAALASPEAKPAAAAPAPSAPSSLGVPGMAQAGGGEGSGLIDIRAMAGAYLGTKDDAPALGGGAAAASSAAAVDLPVFSATSFEQPSSVLLPTAAAGGQNNKLLYALLGVIGLLVVAAVVLVIVVVKGGSKETPRTQVAALTPNGDQGATPDKTGTDLTKPEGDQDKPEGDQAKPEGDQDKPEGDQDKPDEDKEPAKKPSHSSSSSHSSSKKPSHSSSSSHSSSKKPSHSSSSSSKKPESSSSSSSGKCLDEVACLLADNPPACCSKYGGSSSKSSSSKKPAAAANSNLPERLNDSGDIKAGIAKVRGRVSACGDKSNAKGQVKIRIKVSPSGSVSSASVSSAPDKALGACVASACKSAKFIKTQKGGSFTYPFVFR